MTAPRDPKPDTQNGQILAYMRRHGWITPMDALRDCACMRLAARIQELEEDYGWKIDAELVTEGGKTFARYRLRGAGN